MPPCFRTATPTHAHSPIPPTVSRRYNNRSGIGRPCRFEPAWKATGVYGEALALFLHQQGVTVSVVNPSRIKAFAQSELLRTKTDAGDGVLKHNRPFDPNDAPAT